MTGAPGRPPVPFRDRGRGRHHQSDARAAAAPARAGIRVGDLRRAHRPGPSRPHPLGPRLPRSGNRAPPAPPFDGVRGLRRRHRPAQRRSSPCTTTSPRSSTSRANRSAVTFGSGANSCMTLARRSLFGVADSNFNRREMLAVGFRRVEVLPVRVDFSEFTEEAGGAHSRSNDWLFVGRIIGNKCQHDLVTAFAHYHRTFDTDARLLLIGDTRAEDYVSVVRAQAERLGVTDRVILIGQGVRHAAQVGVRRRRRLRLGQRTRGIRRTDPRGHGRRGSGGGLRRRRRSRDDGRRRGPAAHQGAGRGGRHRAGVQSDPELQAASDRAAVRCASSRSGVSTAGPCSAGSSTGASGTDLPAGGPGPGAVRDQLQPGRGEPEAGRRAWTGLRGTPCPSTPPKARATTSRPTRTSSGTPRPPPSSPGPKRCPFPMWSSGRCIRRG